MRSLLTLALAGTLAFSAGATSLHEAQAITSLNAVPRGTQVLLSWNPDAKNITGYKVERSKNGSEFEMFSEVQGSNTPVEFLETDFTPFAGLSYYRLTAVLQDGRVLYSNVVPVKFSTNCNSVAPSADKANAKLTESSVLLVVRSADGEEFYSKVEVQNATDPVQCSEADPVLAKGTYTIVASSQQVLYSKQIIVN